eukprot:7811070-Pyramimonas_sp.AAC.1
MAIKRGPQVGRNIPTYTYYRIQFSTFLRLLIGPYSSGSSGIHRRNINQLDTNTRSDPARPAPRSRAIRAAFTRPQDCRFPSPEVTTDWWCRLGRTN